LYVAGEFSENDQEDDMGRRGPLPDPNSSESRRGRNTLHRRPAGNAEPASGAEPASVAAPDFIRDNPTAMEFWGRHAPALVASHRMTPLQADIFAVICEQFAEVRQLTAAVAADGMTLTTPRGPQANPALRALRDARRDLIASSRGFGMDAASDCRLPTEPPKRELSVVEKFRLHKAELEALYD
jgi:P27 family predicted phage terminase small subunit